MNPLTGTLSGDNNKAVVSGVALVAGSEYIKPIFEWLIRDGLSRGLDACCIMPIPDTAQTGLVWLALFGVGYLATWLVPNIRKPAQ